MRPTLTLSFAIAAALLAGCGSVTPTVDASAIDAPTSTIDAPASTIDAPTTPIDGPTAVVDAAVDGPSCVWTQVAQCDTQRTIAQFCPTGTHVGDLRRCDGTTFTPDAQYQMFHLCNCQAASCGCNAIGVSWQEVQCCN